MTASGGPKRNLSDDPAQAVFRIVRLLTYQLLHGCGTEQCPTPTCYSYRKRTSDRPIRKYTASTARSTALALAETGNARRYLCPLMDATKDYPLLQDEGSKIDSKALTQQLSNTDVVKRLCGMSHEHDTFFETALAKVKLASSDTFDLRGFLHSMYCANFFEWFHD